MMETSRLVQRLSKPPTGKGHPLFGKDNRFAFGGGLRNGGLSDTAMDMLRDVWSFDYMGAAEFEFGAVPEALSKMAKAKLGASTISVPLNEVPRNWRDRGKSDPEGEAEVYLLGPTECLDEIADRVGQWARNEHDSALKEGLRFTSALRPVEEWDSDICGWLELNNGFAFFTDREMWLKASELFGVPIGTAAAA